MGVPVPPVTYWTTSETQVERSFRVRTNPPWPTKTLLGQVARTTRTTTQIQSPLWKKVPIGSTLPTRLNRQRKLPGAGKSFRLYRKNASQ